MKSTASIVAALIAAVAVFLALRNPRVPTSVLENGTAVSELELLPYGGFFAGRVSEGGAPLSEPPFDDEDGDEENEEEVGAPPDEPPVASPVEGKRAAAATTSRLEFDFYRDSCPQAERIVKTSLGRIYAKQPDITPGLLRLFFHDCFIVGCDASVLLDDSDGNRSNPIERNAAPNPSLRGFDEIEHIKQELESACPGVVSCADTLALATRDAILLVGGPFYPVFTGRRDSLHSYYTTANAEIPKPEGNISEALRLFSLRGFDTRETVTLLGGHNIGRITCPIAKVRLSNFLGTGQPDPTLDSGFAEELRRTCIVTNNSQTSISLGAKLDSHYYRNILAGRGVLFADQQLMADKGAASFVQAFADDARLFRRDFARAMVKMSMLGVLTGDKGEVRKRCSLPLRISS